jgi:hypothetical protein
MIKAQEQLKITLNSLKDFQKATVISVLNNFKNTNHSNRVLVADEVGLGKTIVAKGVVAELLKDRLNEDQSNKFLKVTYICSNLTLANENKKKLAVFQGDYKEKYVAEPSFGRLVELAITNKSLQVDNDTLLEVNSLTPSTSFNLTSGHGNKWERFIIYRMLIKSSMFVEDRDKLYKFFRGDVKWWYDEEYFEKNYFIEENIFNDFISLLQQELLPSKLETLGMDKGSLASILKKYCDDDSILERPIRLRTFIRIALAQSCAKNLNADLFILDEFQRFGSLLDTNNENEETLIAREVFRKNDHTKILLLSATPFKALSRLDEDEQNEAHLDELRKLLKFLSDNNINFIETYEQERESLLKQILNLQNKEVNIGSISTIHKEAVEKLLSSYICRTERSQVSEDFDGVFDSKQIECEEYFSKDEIKSFISMDQLGQAMNKAYPGRYSSQLLEFYKAAPWALSFLSGYQFKVHLDNHKDDSMVRNALKNSSSGWLSRKSIKNYKLNITKSAPNAKLKAIMNMLFDARGEELLWIPPTLPYYELSGCFTEHDNFTKSLLFSSWALVPRALSGLISYEAERRVLEKKKHQNYFNKAYNPSLRFEGKSSLDIWGLVYPCKTLSEIPFSRTVKSSEDIILERIDIFKEKFSNMPISEELDSRYWYALAPILLDSINGEKDFIKNWFESQLANAKEDGGRYKHLEKLQEHVCQYIEYEYIPPFLYRYLAELSIAGPAICFVRMCKLYWPKSDLDFNLIDDMSMSVMTMFNKPESDSILTKNYPTEKKYWQMVLNYSIDGNFQSMINEYAHLLATSGFSLKEAANRFKDVLGFRTSSIFCQFEEDKNKKQKKSAGNRINSTLRCHYAVPLGTQKIGDDKATQRVGSIRDTFNSPFRPFVLNSTSIGQEGLDFHWYCTRVIHWNLPTNPIDIEQREGRVNRYKSLVVRRRVAEIYSADTSKEENDIWSEVFKIANLNTIKNRKSDLIPYWHLAEGKAKIERIVPMMPMSKEVNRLKEALKILSLYRLAFGQPRQEEFLTNLLERNMSSEEIKIIIKALVINLAPIVHQKQPEILNK